jgi:hypothetical protein
MSYTITVEQRCLLADCVRTGLVGWLITCPVAGQQCRILQARATTMTGFSFCRFVGLAAVHFGKDYRSHRPGSPATFPLSIEEAAALANDVELGFATADQLFAAALVAAHSPFAQPEVKGRDWRTYNAMLAGIGIDPWAGDPTWSRQVRDRLRPFRRAVAAHAVAAE